MKPSSTTVPARGTSAPPVERIVILGAAGRDFHNFNVVYRDNPAVEVVAFTAAQISGIAGRRYPPALAGARYPQGIPIVEEDELETLCREQQVDQVVFAYSDVPHLQVMHLASRALAAGSDFALLGPVRTMLQSRVPVIAVSAVRTGCGKSQTTRYLARKLRDLDLRVAVIRHPMPYGDLAAQRVQRFTSRGDLDAAQCTIEEREEYEPHLAAGGMVYAGVDYARILERAEGEADVILWDGGNNDFPFLHPDLHVVLVDALRPGHETTHHPGEAVLRMADVIIVAKADAAPAADAAMVAATARRINPRAQIIRAGSPITLEQHARVSGKRVLAVEDGPTLTHGGMAFGAALIAAERAQATNVIDPRPWAAPEIAKVYSRYPHIGAVLPAIGYTPQQLDDLRATINAADADLVVSGTPLDLAALIKVNKPVLRARYDFIELEPPGLWGAVKESLKTLLRRKP